MSQRYLRRTEASAYLRERWGLFYAPSTLAKLACGDNAPAQHRCGRTALYTTAALDQWASTRIRAVGKATIDVTVDVTVLSTALPPLAGNGGEWRVAT